MSALCSRNVIGVGGCVKYVKSIGVVYVCCGNFVVKSNRSYESSLPGVVVNANEYSVIIFVY